MTYEELEILIKNDEHRQLELKKTTGELKDGMHSACDFLNTEGGWLIFGVTPSSLKILGQEVTDNTQREIAQALSYLEPQVDVRVEYVDIPDRPNQKAIAMHFNAWLWGNIPYTYHGCPYYRVESTTKEMPRDMFDLRLRQSKPDFFAWERQPSDFKGIDSLDENLIRGVVRLGVERGRMPESAMTEPIKDILDKWKLLDGDKLLNAATALFTKETGMYLQLSISLARFRGTDKNEFIDSQQAEGNIFVLLNEAMNFFRKHLSMHGKVVGLIRDEWLEVPAEALREGILNSLCHREWGRYCLPVYLAIYDDRIEITNTGYLVPPLTAENITQPHSSNPHNKLIANVLYSTSYIERWGSGVKRITDACAYRNVETPTWTTDGYFVTVTFKRPDYNASVPKDVTKDVPKDVPKDDTINDTKDDTKDCIKELSDRQYLMLRFITLDDTITIDEMIQKMKVSPITVKRDLADLQAKGIIAREGGRKNGRWIILKSIQ